MSQVDNGKEYNCQKCGKFLSKITQSKGGIVRLAKQAARAEDGSTRQQKLIAEIDQLKKAIEWDQKELANHKAECKYQQRYYD